MRIGWAFTGAGHLLKESVGEFVKLAKDNSVTVFMSNASIEVLKMYGLYETVVKYTGGRYKELATDENQKYSYPITGRLSLGKYDILILSPATANTVAKIVHGISDTIVTNAVAQAGKGNVPTIVVPVDITPGDIDTVLPSKLELNKCKKCDPCTAALACPHNAFIPYKEISLLNCVGCGQCKISCQYDAISEGKIIQMHMRDIDIKNTEELRKIDEITVLEHPSEIIQYIDENINK
ncbi:MAG: dihydromethanopterin reductase (acceptor) [Methanobrevibacter wolinii]|nr:dihydromethanopterin reductase (acceptor) [Methanobrevibacter wolinii]